MLKFKLNVSQKLMVPGIELMEHPHAKILIKAKGYFSSLCPVSRD